MLVVVLLGLSAAALLTVEDGVGRTHRTFAGGPTTAQTISWATSRSRRPA